MFIKGGRFLARTAKKTRVHLRSLRGRGPISRERRVGHLFQSKKSIREGIRKPRVSHKKTGVTHSRRKVEEGSSSFLKTHSARDQKGPPPSNERRNVKKPSWPQKSLRHGINDHIRLPRKEGQAYEEETEPGKGEKAHCDSSLSD